MQNTQETTFGMDDYIQETNGNGPAASYASSSHYVPENYNTNNIMEIGQITQPMFNAPSTSDSRVLTDANLNRVYYANDTDASELRNLLESWNIIGLFPHFERKYSLLILWSLVAI